MGNGIGAGFSLIGCWFTRGRIARPWHDSYRRLAAWSCPCAGPPFLSRPATCTQELLICRLEFLNMPNTLISRDGLRLWVYKMAFKMLLNKYNLTVVSLSHSEYTWQNCTSADSWTAQPDEYNCKEESGTGTAPVVVFGCTWLTLNRIPAKIKGCLRKSLQKCKLSKS